MLWKQLFPFKVESWSQFHLARLAAVLSSSDQAAAKMFLWNVLWTPAAYVNQINRFLLALSTNVTTWQERQHFNRSSQHLHIQSAVLQDTDGGASLFGVDTSLKPLQWNTAALQ